MKKKLLFLFVSAMLIATFVLPLSVFAVSPMSATAKAGDAVVDGVITEGEYADPFILNGETGAVWAGLSAISSPITYRFAWSEKGLYIALSYAESMDGDSQLQINCNPGGQLTANQQGLFVTIYPAGKVTLHNHNTPLGDIDTTTLWVDVTSKVTLASKAADGVKTTEVLIPIDAFRISDPAFTFSAGDMACSAFAVLIENGAAKEVGASVSGDLSDWTTGALGLGTLTLKAADSTVVPGDPTEAPADPTPTPGTNPGTGDATWIVLALCGVALALTVILVIARKTKETV